MKNKSKVITFGQTSQTVVLLFPQNLFLSSIYSAGEIATDPEGKVVGNNVVKEKTKSRRLDEVVSKAIG